MLFFQLDFRNRGKVNVSNYRRPESMCRHAQGLISCGGSATLAAKQEGKMRNPHKTDRELRKFGYIPDSDIRSIMREIEAVKLDLRRERGLADLWVRGHRYPIEFERMLKMSWDDPERDALMIHARYFLQQARRAVREFKRHHGRVPA
jgi:hypothetical protein